MIDMDLTEIVNNAKVAESRHAAKALLKKAGITEAPVMLNVIIRYVPKIYNLVIRGTNDLPKGLDAFTYKEEGLTIIGYNQSVALVRQKFSVAHELGHLYMGHMHGQSSLDFNSIDFDEIEANQFAANLIMPTELLRKDIKTGLCKVRDLASRYIVSEEAMWWQLSKSGLINML